MVFDREHLVARLNDLQRWRKAFFRQLSRAVNHDEVIQHAREEGQMSGRFVFMIVMSCAIATLGLLLSSPAVIIGAMLISPLMGPIMLMGFSLSILDLAAMRRAIFTLGCGVLAALAISFLIVSLSPLSEATSEIVARTRPNLFDLLVAIFSGLAGGYAAINRKGETILGVAIATALMPPLAVTGYGLAVGSASVAGGAFFLFMTNLLAIALSATIISRFYSFGSSHGRGATVWQSAMIIFVFGALSVPLGLTLNDIAYETRTINTVKDKLLDPFDGEEARISDVSVIFPRKANVQVDATVLTKSLVPGAEQALVAELSNDLARQVDVNLDQVLIDEDKELEKEAFLRLADSTLAAPLRTEISRLQEFGQIRQTEAELRTAIPFPASAADIDAARRKAVLVAAPDPALPIATYRTLEAGLSANFPDWTIEVVPPVTELPLIGFEQASDVISPANQPVMEDILWALRRWSVKNVEVVGYASTAGELRRFDNKSLALRRAQNVATILEANGIGTSSLGEYRAFRQEVNEKQLGYQRFQTVLVRPVN